MRSKPNGPRRLYAIDVIDFCQHASMTADLVLSQVPNLEHETQDHLNTIKHNMDAIINDKLAHLKFDDNEIGALEYFLTTAKSQDLPTVSEELISSEAEFKETDGHDANKRKALLIKSTVLLHRIDIKLSAIKKEIDVKASILKAGHNLLVAAISKVEKLLKLFESHHSPSHNKSESEHEFEEAKSTMHALLTDLEGVIFNKEVAPPPFTDSESPQPSASAVVAGDPNPTL